jgi:signal transduction histidine kinase
MSIRPAVRTVDSGGSASVFDRMTADEALPASVPGRRGLAALRRVLSRLVRVAAVVLPWTIGLFYVLVAIDSPDRSNVGRVVGGLLGLVQVVALRWRREQPERVAAVVLAAALPFHFVVEEVVIPFAGLMAVWSLALARRPGVSLVGLAGLLAVCSANFATTTVDDTVFTMVVSVSVWALAEAARSRRAAIEDETRRALADERARISRELHDVIAHSVSAIVIQAGAASDVFDRRPDQARAALGAIEAAGRDALGELRRLLGGVRLHDDDASPAPPAAGLARVDELAAPLRAAGVKVAVAREGEPGPLPAGVDLGAYRIVQEALTNTLRHANATTAEVTLRYSTDAIEIEVVDDGRGAPGRSGDGPGYGLIGMRERANLLGGTLEAGPTAHGGYRVHARLPMGAAP